MCIAGLALLATCCAGPPAFRNPPAEPPSDGAEYLLRISVNGQAPLDLYCALSPVVIETEPPYHLVECEPRRMALKEGDTVDLYVGHLPTGQKKIWTGLTPADFLLKTQTSVTSTSAGHEFPEWNGETVLFKGLDIFAPDLPGSDYF